MNLHVSSDIYAIIKSSDILICATKPQDRLNINVLEGVVEVVEVRQTNTEITLRIDAKTTLVALMQNEEESFHLGQKAYALISYNNIIIGL